MLIIGVTKYFNQFLSTIQSASKKITISPMVYFKPVFNAVLFPKGFCSITVILESILAKCSAYLNVLSLPPATIIISKLEYVEISTLSIVLHIIFSSFQAGIITETCGKFIGSLLDSTVSIGLI